MNVTIADAALERARACGQEPPSHDRLASLGAVLAGLAEGIDVPAVAQLQAGQPRVDPAP